MKLSPLALAVALAPGLVLAATEQTRKNSELPPLVVTRATALHNPVPSSVAVIDRQQIEASASHDLLDLLRSQAGLQIRDTMGDGNRVALSLRGFGENAGNNTLILVDDHRLNQPSLATPDLNAVPLDNIERIEIIRGAGAVLYRQPGRRRGDQHRHPHAAAQQGLCRRPALAVTTSKPTGAACPADSGGGFSLYASGEIRNSDNYRDHNNASYSNAFTRLRYDHAAGHALYEYQTVDDELLYPGSLTLDQRRADRKQSLSSDWNDSKTQVHRFALEQRLERDLDRQFRLQPQRSGWRRPALDPVRAGHPHGKPQPAPDCPLGHGPGPQRMAARPRPHHQRL